MTHVPGQTAIRSRVDLAPDVAQRTTSSTRTAVGSSATSFAKALASESVRWIEPKRTSLSAAEARAAIANAFEAQTGRPLSASGQAILTAQWAHETGHGAKMFNYNFGGIKGVGPTGLAVAQRTREGHGATERRIVDGFRAYTSAEQGAGDYVRLLLSRYGSAAGAAERGDATGFVRGLKENGYFTGDPTAYERSIAAISNQLATSAGEPRATASITDVEPLARNNGNAASVSQNSKAVENAGQLSLRDTRLLESPKPTDLLLWGTGEQPWYAASRIGTDELRATRALDMADQIARAALRIAQDDRDSSR